MWAKPNILSGALLFIVLTLSLAACDLISGQGSQLTIEERVQTGIAETKALEMHVQTVVAGTLAASGKPGQDQVVLGSVRASNADAVPASADLQALTATVTPTVAVTPTPATTMVTVSRSTNCRSGPGTEYEINGALMVGVQAEVVGSFPDWNYWIIKNPDKAGECWLWGEYATVVGETASLPRFTPPPTPVLVVDWSGTWSSRQGNMNYYYSEYSLKQTGMNVTGADISGAIKNSIYGTLSADKLTLSGQVYDNAGVNIGTFSWQLLNNNQFSGHAVTHYTYQWVGYRAGAGFPVP